MSEDCIRVVGSGQATPDKRRRNYKLCEASACIQSLQVLGFYVCEYLEKCNCIHLAVQTNILIYNYIYRVCRHIHTYVCTMVGCESARHLKDFWLICLLQHPQASCHQFFYFSITHVCVYTYVCMLSYSAMTNLHDLIYLWSMKEKNSRT